MDPFGTRFVRAQDPVMNGDQLPVVQAPDRVSRRLDLNMPPNPAMGHRVAVGLEGHQAVAGDGPRDPLLDRVGRLGPMIDVQALFLPEHLGRLPMGGPVGPLLCPFRVHPPAVAQGHHEQVNLDPLAGQNGPALAPVDLVLPAGRRLEPHRRLREGLGPQRADVTPDDIIASGVALLPDLLIDGPGAVSYRAIAASRFFMNSRNGARSRLPCRSL